MVATVVADIDQNYRMQKKQFSSSDLNELHEQLSAWRQDRPAGTRIPEEVWEAATSLARIHNAGHVGRFLHLDYYKLRNRLRGASEPPARRARRKSPATFVEIPRPDGLPETPCSRMCSVELSDGRKAQLRMQVPADASTLVALAQAFWRRHP